MDNRILNYLILESLYESTHIQVYRAIDETTQQKVVLKLLKDAHPSMSEVSKLVHAFEVVKNVEIPGIVKTLELKQYENTPVLVLENFDGCPLQTYLKNYPLDLETFLTIAIVLSSTIGDLHYHHIIHKDIKPQNILINPATMEVKIIDFSIASHLSHENPRLLNRHVLEGTLNYISPEQTGRINRELDYRTDIYSLGVTLYEAITGQLLFYSLDPLELVHLHIAKTPPSPHQIKPSIPKAISDIIMKCLAKIPEERYHSAYGLKNDFEECLGQLKKHQKIEQFNPGEKDIFDIFQIPQKLYGRDKEITLLMKAFDQICSGKTECVIISGYSGIGKTSLVMEIQKSIIKQRGYFISGKFDHLKRNMPFLGLIQAFRDLMHQVLTESETDLAILKHKLLGALQNNGQVLIELIPELELIIGKQPQIPTLATHESQNRLKIFVRKFLQIFCKKEHPIVIFLDDLQWASPASLSLLKELMTDPTIQYLLLIGSYRDHEVVASDPLIVTIEEIKKERSNTTELTLSPLTQENVTQLTADTLHSRPMCVEALAQILYQKTGGNPFFLIQLLKKLHKESLIYFDLATKLWAWHLERIERMEISENVVDLLVQKIQLLAPSTQAILILASALGVRFDIKLLARESNLPLSTTLKILWNAVLEELIQPVDENYHLIETESLEIQNSEELKKIEIPFRFVHDRIQQAAYSLITENEKEKLHYKIGKLMLHEIPEDEVDERIFKILSHFNLALSQFTTEDERQKLAQMNLRACRLAKKAAAYPTAFECISISQQLLKPNNWEENYEFTYDVYLELAECSYLLKRFEHIDELTNMILSRAKTRIDKGRLYILKMNYFTNISSTERAIQEGLECLQLFGIEVEEHPSKFKVLWELGKLKLKLRQHSITSILNLPPIQDEDRHFIMRALIHVSIPAYLINKHLLCVLTCTMVSLSIDYGLCDCSFFAFLSYAGTIEYLFRDYPHAYELGRIAINLCDRYSNSGYQCRVNYAMAIILNHWMQPMNTNEEYMDRAYQAGTESGEIMFMSFIGVFYGFADGAFYKNVDHALKKMHRYRNLIFSCKNKQAMQSYIMKEQILAGLHNSDFDGSFIRTLEFDEETYFSDLKKDSELKNTLQAYTAYRCMTCYLFGHYQAVMRIYNESSETRDALIGLTTERDLNFYHTLTLLALYPEKTWVEKWKTWRQVQKNLKLLKRWNELCPSNNSHRYALINAEIAKMQGDFTKAEPLYDQAINLANENEFTIEEALAYELAGRFYLSRNRLLIAKTHLELAYTAYYRCQAISKAVDLEKRYPEMLEKIKLEQEKIQQKKRGHDISMPIVSSFSTTTQDSMLDLNSIMQAATILSGEIHLGKLLDKMLKIAIENAGADRAIFLMEQKGRWLIQGEKILGQENSIVLKGTPYEERIEDLSVSVIQYVVRTNQTVVLDDAMHLGIFTEDPYINKTKQKSILCLPISHQGKLAGILYFENNSSTEAFTPNRLGILRLLSSEIATAIRNAVLYSDLEQASDNLKNLNAQLQYYNRNLENKVTERTHELQEKNIELKETLASLQEMQKQIIQQEKLASLGSLTQGIAHEIKNPLNFINNFASLSLELIDDLKKTLTALSEEGQNEIRELASHLQMNLEKIHSHSVRMDGIVVSMLRHSKDSKGEKEPTNLNLLLKEYVALSKKSFEQKNPIKGLEIEMVLDPNLKTAFIVSQDVGRAFMNILDNAFYALYQKQKSKPEFVPKLVITTQQLAEDIKLTIRDNGIGIPESNRPRLFHPFFTTKPTGTGTGLGLSIAYDIVVHEHAGQIHVQSKEDEFTEFQMRIPSREIKKQMVLS